MIKQMRGESVAYVRRGYIGGGIVGRRTNEGKWRSGHRLEKKFLLNILSLSLSPFSFSAIFLLDAVFVGSDAAKRWRDEA